MTTRSASSSLRRRIIWTAALAAIITFVSVVSIVAYRTAQREVLGPADQQSGGNAASVAEQPAKASENRAAANQTPAFHSPQFGYSVRLAESSWVPWGDLAEVVPEAEWGALLGDYGRFLVIPFSLLGLDPRTEALDHALLARLAIAWPGDPLGDVKQIVRDGAGGHSFELARDVAGAENRYKILVLRRGG